MVKSLYSSEMEERRKISLSIVGGEGSLELEFMKYKKSTSVQEEWQKFSIEHITLSCMDVEIHMKY